MHADNRAYECASCFIDCAKLASCCSALQSKHGTNELGYLNFRATAPAYFWEDYPELLAGRDLHGKGTWLGVTKTGRAAWLTNFREVHAHSASALPAGQCSEQRQYIKADNLTY